MSVALPGGVVFPDLVLDFLGRSSTRSAPVTDADKRRRDEVDELQKAMLANQVQPIAVHRPSARGTEYSALND